MPQGVLFRRLIFAYGSAAAIISVLILLAQAIIQVQLYTEVTTRDLATLISMQELHSQHLLRNSLMSLTNSNNTAINPLHIDPASQIQEDLIFLEATNKQLLDSRQTPVVIVTRIQTVQPDYRVMDTASHQLLLDMKKHAKGDQEKQVTLVFIHEQAYLTGTYSAFVMLTQQADDNISIIRALELILCIVALGTITFEAFGIVIPSIRDYVAALQKLEQATQHVVSSQ